MAKVSRPAMFLGVLVLGTLAVRGLYSPVLAQDLFAGKSLRSLIWGVPARLVGCAEGTIHHGVVLQIPRDASAVKDCRQGYDLDQTVIVLLEPKVPCAGSCRALFSGEITQPVLLEGELRWSGFAVSLGRVVGWGFGNQLHGWHQHQITIWRAEPAPSP